MLPYLDFSAFINSSCFPDSTIRPPSIQWITSALTIVLRRWATKMHPDLEEEEEEEEDDDDDDSEAEEEERVFSRAA